MSAAGRTIETAGVPGEAGVADETGAPGATPGGKRLGRAALMVAGAAVLSLVALAYLNPHLMLDIADQLWACF